MPLTSAVLSKIINGLAIPLFVIDSQHVLTHWNTALEALTGYKKESVIGKAEQWRPFYNEKRPTMADLIIEGSSLHEVQEHYGNKYRASSLIDGAFEAEDFFPALGAQGAWLHFTASPIFDDSGKTIGAIETLLDISERKKLEDNLHIYSQQINQALEEERMHLAREIHDELSQLIGSASRQLDNLLRKKINVGVNELADLENIRDLLTDAARAMNVMIKNLRPPLLDDLGLIPAMRSLCTSLESTEGVITRFNVRGEEIRLNQKTELVLFRIIQEALNNVKKHAGANTVSLDVSLQEHEIILIVKDDGKGFLIPDSMDDLPRSGKLGLMGMQERVRLLGGTFDMLSTPGQGTSLTFIIPISRG